MSSLVIMRSLAVFPSAMLANMHKVCKKTTQSLLHTQTTTNSCKCFCVSHLLFDLYAMFSLQDKSDRLHYLLPVWAHDLVYMLAKTMRQLPCVCVCYTKLICSSILNMQICVFYRSGGQQISKQPQCFHEHIGIRVRQESKELFCAQRSNDLHFHLLICLVRHILHTHYKYAVFNLRCYYSFGMVR